MCLIGLADFGPALGLGLRVYDLRFDLYGLGSKVTDVCLVLAYGFRPWACSGLGLNSWKCPDPLKNPKNGTPS